MFELPVREPCDLCEGMAGREERWAIIDETAHTLTVINPWQFEIGQCCVITRRHGRELARLERSASVRMVSTSQGVAACSPPECPPGSGV